MKPIVPNDEAQTDISFIEGFYNRRRRRSSLGYHSPDEFERHFNEGFNPSPLFDGISKQLSVSCPSEFVVVTE